MPYQTAPVPAGYRIKTYRREQYAYHLRLSDERNGARESRYGLGASGHIRDVMTRWIRRCVRDQPVVIGAAHIEPNRDLLSHQAVLRAWAYAYQDVDPEHREVLASMVDSNCGHVVPLLAPS